MLKSARRKEVKTDTEKKHSYRSMMGGYKFKRFSKRGKRKTKEVKDT